MRRLLFAFLLLLPLAAAAAVLSGCSPHIGDHCNLNTDCSIQGTLFCDTSQPNGYCTFFNCIPDSCQNNAVCVMLRPSVPGCPYDDYQSPARTARTMCLAPCSQDSDCRTSEGYVCANPTHEPWNAIVVDNTQGQKVCLVAPSSDAGDAGVPASFVDAAGVCQVTGPSVPPLEAGVHLEDAGAAGGEAGAEAGAGAVDAAVDAADAGADAGADAAVGADATGGD
jgi:hypothetical protein